MHRVLNIAEKQKKKKNTEWNDADFGPSESDPSGQFSLIYYDGIPPKDWPGL